MTKEIPVWTLKTATPQDRERVEQAYHSGTMQITTWPETKAIRARAKQQGWPAPWFIFDGGFIKKMLESDENFALALNESGVKILIPLEHYTVSDEQLRAFDAMYEETEDMGALGQRPTRWGSLVGALREIRRAIEADVVVEIEGKTFKQVGSFLTWAHERYHMLEDGYDSWIGDDDS